MTVVIVGGGTSGSVLAARLSQSPDREVILLEAGPDDREYDSSILTPAHAHEVWRESPWVDRFTMSQHDGPELNLVAGRVLGGTSAVNYLATVRGQPADYDGWAAMGLDGWAWRDVVSTFKSLETDADFPDSPIHGHDGPLAVRRWSPETFSPYQRAFYDGLLRLGVPHSPDINDPDTLPGVGVFPATVRPGTTERLTVSQAYLTDEVRDRPNLTIRCETPADRVVVEEGRAVGVLTTDGEFIPAEDTIVCAGALGSPALLQRSGIGPRSVLESAGIAVVHEAPGVGANLQDHIGAILGYQMEERVAVGASPAQPVWLDSSAAGVDVHVFATPLPTGPDGPTVFALLVFLLRLTGRGKVSVTSADAAAPLAISAPQASEGDVNRLAPVLATLGAWEETPEFKSLRATRLLPQGALDEADSASAAWSAARTSYGHTVGTCAMGPAVDPMAVLDERCAVRGVGGVSVVDASAIPTIPAGNTYLGCVMVAERVARFWQDSR